MKNKFSLYGEEKSNVAVKEYINNALKNWLSSKTRYRYILDNIDGNNVLDYGCGWGVFSKIIELHKKANVLGIDIDNESIRVAKKFIGESKKLKFSNRHIKQIKKESFDCVVSSGVIQNTLNPGNYLSECNRVLKKNGKLIISVYNEINPLRFISQYLINDQKIKNIFKLDHNLTRDPVVAWGFYDFCRMAHLLGFEYIDHDFTEGIPFINGYIYFDPLKKYYYVTVFILKKKKYIKPFE